MTCKVCGHEFTPKKEERYEAWEQENLLAFSVKYDCFDCPECGCQNVAGKRMSRCEDNSDILYENPNEKRTEKI